MLGRRVRRTRAGEVVLRLSAEERQVLRALPGQLRHLLVDEPDDPALRRLTPPAYSGDPEHEAEYRRFMGDELRERRLAALALMDETVDAERLSEEQAQAWLAALNSLRLVLGTRLDVTEEMAGAELDPDDPQAPLLALYGYLSWLEDQLVEALAGAL
ncbi:MAG: DUF2017 domain-containing protein [Actinomycetota bacterium]|nr:DUF2017 domain-containing protein [Actinomycetota bacterium]